MKTFLYNIIRFFSSIFQAKIYWKFNLANLENCKIDKRSFLNKPYGMRNVEIGLGTAIGPNSRITYTKIGRFCSIGPNFFCGWGIHPVNGVSINPAFYSTRKQNGFTYSLTDKIEERKPILIGNDVFIGANVTVLDGITISDGAIIGAGAVVSKNIPPYAIAVGCPIRIIKYRFTSDIITNLLDLKWWDQDEKTFKKVEEYFFDVQRFVEEHKKK